MEHYNLEIRCPYGISIYQNTSREIIYINNFKPIQESEIKTKIPNENLVAQVRIKPSQYYAHISVDDEGEIFVSNDLQAVVDKINYVIKERTQSIFLEKIAAFISEYPKHFQEIDVELNRVVDLLQTDNFINQEEVEIQGYFLCDIGCFKSRELFSRETLLSKDVEQKIRNIFLSNAENRFPSDIVKRINADVITTSIRNLEELIAYPQDKWFQVSTDFHRRLLHIHNNNNIFAFGEQYLFRVMINDLISPVIEIHRRSDKIKYFIAKEQQFGEFLQTFSSDNYSF